MSRLGASSSTPRRTRPHGRLFRWFERTVLSACLTVVAFVLERQVLKALKRGQLAPAPRTASEQEDLVGEGLGVLPVAHPDPGTASASA